MSPKLRLFLATVLAGALIAFVAIGAARASRPDPGIPAQMATPTPELSTF